MKQICHVLLVIHAFVVEGSLRVSKLLQETSVISTRAQFSVERDSADWVKTFSRTGDAQNNERFGSSVAISRDGSTKSVGAERGLNSLGAVSGRAYVYRDGDPNYYVFTGEEGIECGRSVALSQNGNTVAFGAFKSNRNGTESGHAEVWRYSGSSWIEIGTLVGAAEGDRSGVSVSLSNTGDIVAVGGYGNDENGMNSGHTRVFQYDTSFSHWSQLGQNIVGETTGDLSGESVSLSGNGLTLIVGAAENDSLGDGNSDNSGHARVYRFNDSSKTWVKLCCDLGRSAAGDLYGASVSLSENGQIVAVGATQDPQGNSGSGYVRIFEYNESDNAWNQLGSNLPGDAVGDLFGGSVSLSGDGKILAVGARKVNEDFGRIQIFVFEGNAWVQELSIEGAGDFGAEVALSVDGASLFVGAPLNNTAVVFSTSNLEKIGLTKRVRGASGDAARLAVIISEAHKLVENTNANGAWAYVFEDGELRSTRKKLVVLDNLKNNAAHVGIDVTANDAMMQLTSARFILEMEKAYYEELDDVIVEEETTNEFPKSKEQQSDGGLKQLFVDSNISKLLTEMKNVEGKIANDANEGYEYLFQASEDTTVEDRVHVLRGVLDNIIEEGVDVLAQDALLQLQSTICVLKMLRIYENMAAESDNDNTEALDQASRNDLFSLIEKEDWSSAQYLIKNSASFSEAMELLPTPLTDQLKSHLTKGEMDKVEEQLEQVGEDIEKHLTDINAEDNRGEVEFSYKMLDLLAFMRREAPKSIEKEVSESY